MEQEISNSRPSKSNDEKVMQGDLHNRLFDIFNRRAERIAFIQGDSDVDFQSIADSISIARSAGVDRVGWLPPGAAEIR